MPSSPSPLSADVPRRSPISFRAILLGLCGVTLICGLTPYNDYALNNTFLIGNNLPLGVVMLTFLFVIFVNGPLRRFAPDKAFTGGELTVAFSMTLVSCALPSSGLMRYFPPSLVMPFYHAQDDREFLDLFESLHVPDWLFPSFSGKTPREWINDPVVTDFIGRWTHAGPVPYLAWVRPALTWGIFFAALFASLLSIVAIVRRQWFENERLAFPLAQIYVSLLEEPPRGKMLNSVLARRSFWIAFASVFLLHCWNGLYQYDPKHFPRIPVNYNLWDLFSEQPWVFVDTKIKDAAIFFTVAGVTYFLPTSVAFSLWFFYIAQQGYRVYLGVFQGDPTPHGQDDQQFGGILAYALAVLWIGRLHWKLVIAQALRGHRPGEPEGRYFSYRTLAWILVASVITMIGWLTLAGAGVLAATFSILFLLLMFMITTRFVAEAGLVHSGRLVTMYRPWQMLVRAGWSMPISEQSYYFNSLLQCVHYDFREIVPVYASHGIKVADHTIYADHELKSDTPADRAVGRKFLATLALALFVGYFVSFGSTLWTEYHYAFTKDMQGRMVNEWGSYKNPLYSVVGATVQYRKQEFDQPHSSAGHFTFGFAFTALLSFLRLRYTGFPLHPIGYLMLGTFPVAHLWFSVFWGWLAKILIVRFGGGRMYASARPFFIGLIVGESAAAGFWLIMGIVLSALNLPYRPINIMPS